MSNFEKVKIFMKAFGQEVKEKAEFPSDKTTSLRCDLINEELQELHEAIKKKDIKETNNFIEKRNYGDCSFTFFQQKSG